MKVVADTSPLIFFSKLGYLYYLRIVFETVYIPKAVFEEVTARKDEVLNSIKAMIEESFVVVEEAEPALALTNLHSGEVEAITLAKRLNCWVILDDSKARRIAKREGLRVIGTAGLLKVIIKRGLIKEEAEVLFERLARYGFRMRRRVFLNILEN